MARHIIWDFDGTLAFNRNGWTRTMQKVLGERYGMSVPFEKLNPHFQSGFPWHDWEKSHEHIKNGDEYWGLIHAVFNRLYEALRIDRALHARISSDFRDEYLRLENWSLFPDTIAALEHASRSRCISVVLSNNIPELPEIAAALGIKGFFRHIFVSAKIGYEKPDARAFHIALDGVKEKGNVWVIGDSYAADIRGALHAGLKAVLVRREHPKAIYFTPGLEGIWKFMTR